MRRAAGALAALCFALVAPQEALAQQDPAALVRAGVSARREGHDEQALALFQQALALDPRPSTRAQVGFALQALGRWLEAERELRGAAEAQDPWVQRNGAVLRGALDTVRAHLGSLELRCAPAGARAFVDGVEAGVCPLAGELRVPAGSVLVSVRAEGFHTLERTLTVTAGERARESLELRPREAEPPPARVEIAPPLVLGAGAPPTPPAPVQPPPRERPAPPPEPSRSWATPLSVALLGAGALAGGAVAWWARGSALGAVLSAGCTETAASYECAPGVADVTRAQQEHERARAADAAGLALWILGGAAVAGGVLWLAVDRSRARTEAPSRATTWRLAPTPRGLAVSF